jgi:iron-sulfur cluster assembly protein
MITLTPLAGETLRKIRRENSLPETAAVRIGVTRDGCEGSGTAFRYLLDFDAEPAKDGDQIFESESLRILVDRESLPHLDGLELDVRQEFGAAKFLFRNPRAHHACGCGKTFSEERR